MGYSARKAFPNIVGKKPELVHAFPQTKKTTNNKLGMSARSLELIYTLADWPRAYTHRDIHIVGERERYREHE